MANVVGQRHEIYSYRDVETITPRKGEIIIINNTFEYKASPITLVGDGLNNVEVLFQKWNNGEGSPFRTEAEQDEKDIEEARIRAKEDTTLRETIAAETAACTDAINAETAARQQGDADTLTAAKDYTDEAQLATQTWLRAVDTKSELRTTGLNSKINYLCRVIKDKNDERDNNGVYQAIAGWENEPVWTFFGDNTDFIDETELADAIDEHNTDETAHEDIRETIAEVNRDLQEQINTLAPEGLENLPQILAGKADKVSNATEGNFARLDEGGNLTDSGKGPDDFIKELAHNDTLVGEGTSGNPLGVNLPLSAIIALTANNQEQALANLYGGVWGKATIQPRSITFENNNTQSGSYTVISSAATSQNIPAPLAGRIVTINVSDCVFGSSVYVTSNIRGSILYGPIGDENHSSVSISVTLLDGEILSIAVSPGYFSDMININWTRQRINSLEYLYTRL